MTLNPDQMPEGRSIPLPDQIRSLSYPLENTSDLDALLNHIGDARFVLLGEASHGTSEYYTWRGRITQRLIEEKGFNFIGVEGDWPDCYRVNRYIKAYTDSGENARQVLQAFERWPSWMWANWEIVALAEWLRAYNDANRRNVGFFGLDVYSLWDSMASVLEYLSQHNPDALEMAQRAYYCFEPYGEDAQEYAWRTRMTPEDCEDEVVDLLVELRRRVSEYDADSEAAFSAEQNALVMVNAEHYYRAMVRSDENSWNVRDTHMADTLDRLMDFHGPDSKAIVWAHNTHIGDARATDMARGGMHNIGQLVCQRHSDEGVVLVGFASHHGSVIAGPTWGAPMERMVVPNAQPGSWEDVFHQSGAKNRLLLTSELRDRSIFMNTRGHRAIGVVYNPRREQYGNYVPTVLPDRYDAFVYVEESESLHPLHIEPREEAKVPELYPWGL